LPSQIVAQVPMASRTASRRPEASRRARPLFSADPVANRSLHGLAFAWLSLAGVLLLWGPPPHAHAADGHDPLGFPVQGMYCPIPEPGEVPACQSPARERYAAFFEAVDSGRLDPAQTAQIEDALAHSGDERGAYLALSSLAYGYYRLAHEVSKQPQANPRLTARLVRWNELLTKVYGAESTSPALKQAVRTAAEDLAKRAPAVGVTCTAGRVEDCEAARGLVGALAAVDERTSVRSPLSRIIERLLGPSDGALGDPLEER